MKGVPLNEELYKYIVDNFAQEDETIKQIVKNSLAKGIPEIQVSPEGGKFLQLLCKMVNAKDVLEVGTLFGYSSIWIARVLPDDGKLTTLEISPEHAEAAKENFKSAGVENKIDLLFGDANKSLDTLKGKKFDFAFIDADKPSYSNYYDKIVPLMRQGGVIAFDNTLKEGRVIDTEPDEYVRGIQILNQKISTDKRIMSLLVPISDGVTIGVIL